MGRNLVRIVIGVSIVVFIAAVGFLLFLDSDREQTETTSVEPASTSTDTQPGDESENETENDIPAGSQATTSVDADVFDEERAQSSCVSEHEEELEEQDYVEGTLLVAFESGTEFANVRRIIEVEGASFDDEENAEAELEEQGWLTVTMPEGDEAQYMCRFERYPEVRSVRANVEFQLHE